MTYKQILNVMVFYISVVHVSHKGLSLMYAILCFIYTMVGMLLVCKEGATGDDGEGL